MLHVVVVIVIVDGLCDFGGGDGGGWWSDGILFSLVPSLYYTHTHTDSTDGTFSHIFEANITKGST